MEVINWNREVVLRIQLARVNVTRCKPMTALRRYAAQGQSRVGVLSHSDRTLRSPLQPLPMPRLGLQTSSLNSSCGRNTVCLKESTREDKKEQLRTASTYRGDFVHPVAEAGGEPNRRLTSITRCHAQQVSVRTNHELPNVSRLQRLFRSFRRIQEGSWKHLGVVLTPCLQPLALIWRALPQEERIMRGALTVF